MVTSHKMNENEMGYRGSKSKYNFNNKPIQNKNYNFVKEQRVDGSFFMIKNLMKLRCTLMGFERKYQTKISSKQFVILASEVGLAKLLRSCYYQNFSTNSQCKNLPFSNKCD